MENNERLQALLLKILEKFCDGNKAELARQIKKDASYINRLFYPASKPGAKGIGTEIMDACKKAFPLPAGFWDMQPEDALSDRAAPTLIDLEDHPDLVPVRSVKLRLQAGVTGFSIEADQGGGPPIFFRADWLAEKGYKPYNLVAVKVRGPSMESTLFEGDMVVVNSADTEPKDGKVFAVNYEGEAVIKRLVRDGGTWWLSSDNPDQRRFPRKECVEGSCIIVGAVIHRQSEQI